MNHLFVRSDAGRIPLPDNSVDLVFGSPPYCDARTYGIDAQRDCAEWVEWMLELTRESVRVSRGLVLWVCAGVTRDHCYWPACEGLLWEWWKAGGQCWRPAYWHRHGIPGSGHKKWLRADVEYVLALKGESNDFWTDNTAMGKPPKFGQGGKMSNRLSSGSRRDQWGRTITSTWGRFPDGTKDTRIKPSSSLHPNNKGTCSVPVKANPGNLISTGSGGGGSLGSHYAHENEAPFPEDLAEFFVRSFSPPCGLVFDPFSGSGTTVAVAERFGRRGIGGDLRDNQCRLGSRRLAMPHAPISKIVDLPEDDAPFSLR